MLFLVKDSLREVLSDLEHCSDATSMKLTSIFQILSIKLLSWTWTTVSSVCVMTITQDVNYLQWKFYLFLIQANHSNVLQQLRVSSLNVGLSILQVSVIIFQSFIWNLMQTCCSIISHLMTAMNMCTPNSILLTIDTKKLSSRWGEVRKSCQYHLWFIVPSMCY